MSDDGRRPRLASDERAAEVRLLLRAKLKKLDEQRETYGDNELMRRLGLGKNEPSDD